jgi:hypothetical protein
MKLTPITRVSSKDNGFLVVHDTHNPSSEKWYVLPGRRQYTMKRDSIDSKEKPKETSTRVSYIGVETPPDIKPGELEKMIEQRKAKREAKVNNSGKS